jgi:hypothetical protein
MVKKSKNDKNIIDLIQKNHLNKRRKATIKENNPVASAKAKPKIPSLLGIILI